MSWLISSFNMHDLELSIKLHSIDNLIISPQGSVTEVAGMEKVGNINFKQTNKQGKMIIAREIRCTFGNFALLPSCYKIKFNNASSPKYLGK